MIQQPAIYPGAFTTIGHSLYSSHYASERVLEETRRRFGCSKYQFSGLLGQPFPNDYYKWLSGTCRPSPQYLLKLIHLRDLHDAGFALNRARRIDWSTGTIFWRNGKQSTPDRNGTWAELPTPENAQLPGQVPQVGDGGRQILHASQREHLSVNGAR